MIASLIKAMFFRFVTYLKQIEIPFLISAMQLKFKIKF